MLIYQNLYSQWLSAKLRYGLGRCDHSLFHRFRAWFSISLFTCFTRFLPFLCLIFCVNSFFFPLFLIAYGSQIVDTSSSCCFSVVLMHTISWIHDTDTNYNGGCRCNWSRSPTFEFSYNIILQIAYLKTNNFWLSAWLPSTWTSRHRGTWLRAGSCFTFQKSTLFIQFKYAFHLAIPSTTMTSRKI